MTSSQMESLHLIYVNVCNALIYSENLLLEDISKSARDSIRPIRDKLAWLKRAIDMKVGVDLANGVDTLRFDEVNRLMACLPAKHQEELETTIINFLKTIQ